MTQEDKLDAIARYLSAAILVNRKKDRVTPDEVLFWLENNSGNLRRILNEDPGKASGVHAALKRAINAAEHWARDGRRVPLHSRLRPSARMLQAALRKKEAQV